MLLAVLDGALARALNGGRRGRNNGLPLRREFSVVVVTGSWLSLSISSDGSSVTKVVSKSSGSGVVTEAAAVVLSSDALGRIRFRLIDGTIELDGARLLTTRELRSGGRRAPPNDELGTIRGVNEVLDGRMVEAGWMFARALVGLTKVLRELLPPDGTLELGLKAATDPEERRGPEKPRRDSEDFTAVARIVGMISLGVMIAAPLELFFGLNAGRDLELPNGRMTGVKPFFFCEDFASSSSLTLSLIEPSRTAGVGLINCDVGDTTPTAAVGSIANLPSTADGRIAAKILEVLSMT